MDNSLSQVFKVVAIEREAARQHAEESDAQRPDINTLCVNRLTVNLHYYVSLHIR